MKSGRRLWQAQRRASRDRQPELSSPPSPVRAHGRFRRISSGITLDHLPPGTTEQGRHIMLVKIMPNDKGPTGKLADAEVHFTEGAMEGMKLLGFSVWDRKNGPGRNVTFPARQYSVNGERRSFALLRPITDAKSQERIRELVLQAYADFEAQAAIAS
jgi:hypothetical protein